MRVRHSALHLFPFLTMLLSLSAWSPAHANTIWYVVPGGAGSGSGVNWANAFPTIELAIAAASPTDEVWVKSGHYTPPIVGVPPGATSTGYIITKPLKLYGGFLGTETSVQGRLGSFLRTVLDGDINSTPFVANDDALHVVSIADVSDTPGVVIDGFQIRAGYATGTGVNGGGISSARANLDLANCYFWSDIAAPGSNSGGGLYFTSALGSLYATPSYTLNINNSEFADGHGYQGGGIFCDGVRGSIVNTKFSGNMSTGSGAGACLVQMGSGDLLSFTNCVFFNNSCTGQDSFGGGLQLGASGSTAGNAQLVNCAFASNQCAISSSTHLLQAGQAMGISTGSQATIYNSIFFGNNSDDGMGGIIAPIAGAATIDYSDIEGGWSPGYNKDIDPDFVNLGGGNLTLSATSQCLDAADYGQLPTDDLDVDGDGNVSEIIPWDIGWRTRWVDQSTVGDTGTGTYTFLDMGAYELP